MKKLLVGLMSVLTTLTFAQIETPQLSPGASFTQKVGLTDITVEYSRPSMRGRAVFGNIVLMDELWRTGANKNTIFTTSDPIAFGKDTLNAGTYSLFTKPGASEWKVYFYKTLDNWGTPSEWKNENVVLEVSAKPETIANAKETFEISVQSVSLNDAVLTFAWEKTVVGVKFNVPTKTKVNASIKKVMSGPSAGDYYRAADYLYSEKGDMKQALEWINKSVELYGDAPFYILRKKSLIQAENGDVKGALATAKLSLEGAKAAKNDAYVKMNEDSIKEWSKK